MTVEPDRALAARIATDTSNLGVRPGGVLLVHSSLSSMGWVDGGAETVVSGLLEALGPEGTLMMPALSYASVHADQPHFDRDRTPSCVGAVSEHFRTRGGVLRSGSPTHSVCAVGPRARPIVSDHHLDSTPVGPRSPLRKLRDLGGQLMFLGCGMKPNTSMHGVEEDAAAPYLFGSRVTYDLALGTSHHRVTCRPHAFAGWRQCYDRLADLMVGDELRSGAILAAPTQLLEARAMWARGQAALRENSYAFVEPDS